MGLSGHRVGVRHRAGLRRGARRVDCRVDHRRVGVLSHASSRLSSNRGEIGGHWNDFPTFLTF